LNKDENKQPFTDVKIINTAEGSIKYATMTNNEINVYEQHKIVETIKNPGDSTYVFIDYDTEKNLIVIGSVDDGETILNVYPADRSLKSFNFNFDPVKDILLRTFHHVVVVKLQSEGQRLMIVGHRPVRREMLFNDVVREVGSEFQVFSLV